MMLSKAYVIHVLALNEMSLSRTYLCMALRSNSELMNAVFVAKNMKVCLKK